MTGRSQRGADLAAQRALGHRATEMQHDRAGVIDKKGLGHGHNAPIGPIARLLIAPDQSVGIAKLVQKAKRLVDPVAVIHPVKRHARRGQRGQNGMLGAAGRAPAGEEIDHDKPVARQIRARQKRALAQGLQGQIRGDPSLLGGGKGLGIHALLQRVLIVHQLIARDAEKPRSQGKGQHHQPIEFHALRSRRFSTASSRARTRRACQTEARMIAANSPSVTA